MSWDSAPVIQRGPGGATPKGEAYQTAPAVTKAPGKKKTSQTLGFSKGLAKPIGNFVEWVDRASPEVNDKLLKAGVGGDGPSAREGMADWKRSIAEAEQTQRPGLIGEVGGNIVGTLPTLAAKNPLLVGALQGAALTDTPNDAAGVAFDAAGGALLNKAAGVVTDKVIDVAQPFVSPSVQMLKDAGVRLTPGQIKGGKALVAEDKAMSRPGVGDKIAADRTQFTEDFNRGAVNRALLPLGIRLPDDIAAGHEAVAFMQDAAGKAYDKILPNMKLQADQRLAVGVRNGWKAAQDLSEEGQKRFSQIMQNKLRFTPEGELSGRGLTVALRDLRDLAGGFSRGQSEDDRILGDALGSVYDGLQSALSVQNPGYAKALKAANDAYKGNLVVSRAAAGADDGIATAAQYKQASKAVDRSKGKRATAAGKGPMQDYAKAGRAVSGKTPDSGTAGRLNDGNPLAKVRGAVDSGLYEADKMMAALRLAPRPEIAKKLAGLLSEYRDPIRIAGGPVMGGLLAGLLPRE